MGDGLADPADGNWLAAVDGDRGCGDGDPLASSREGRSEATPLGRVGRPEDIAAGILSLLSDEASSVTASVLDIDGGVGASIMNHLKGRRWDRSESD
jgi:NAD(P)-dependent dehydrogenase (short-subunit alcohol dehydrogenase family)